MDQVNAYSHNIYFSFHSIFYLSLRKVSYIVTIAKPGK